MTLLIDESEGWKRKVVGGILVPDDTFYSLESRFLEMRFQHLVFGELKWERAKAPYHKKYTSFVDLFFDNAELTFHCYTYTRRKDKYKVAYAMIRSVCAKLYYFGHTDSLNIIFDQGDVGEINLTQQYLNADTNVVQNIAFCTAGTSSVFGGLQLADLLVGGVASSINERKESMDDGKCRLLEYILERNGGPIVNLPRFPGLHEFKMHRFDPQKYIYDSRK